MTYYCGLLVSLSSNQCGNTVPKPLCQDTCLAARDALSNIFQSSTECVQNALNKTVRDQTVAGYTKFCTSLSLQSGGGQCVSSVGIEATQCGKYGKSIYCLFY